MNRWPAQYPERPCVGETPRTELESRCVTIRLRTLTRRAQRAPTGKSGALPHIWNAMDGAGLHITKPRKRGIGRYRLEFETPSAGGPQWLELGAACAVADSRTPA